MGTLERASVETNAASPRRSEAGHGGASGPAGAPESPAGDDGGIDAVEPGPTPGTGDPCWTPEDRDRVCAEVAHDLWRVMVRHASVQETSTAEAWRGAQEGVADLTGLSSASLRIYGHLHALLSDEVARFVETALPRLLATLTPVAPPRLVTGQGAVRGRIDWGATVAARARQGGTAPTVFAASAAHTSSSTPPARVLVALLRSLAVSCGAVLSPAARQSGETRRWEAIVVGIDETVRHALSHPRLRLLAPPPTDRVAWGRADAPVALGAPGDLTACRRSPREDVRVLAAACDRYVGLVTNQREDDLREALRARVLLPLDDDTLYEVWALLGAAAVFDDLGWPLETAAPIGPHPAPLGYCAPGGVRVRLRFGHTPAHWRRESRYRQVFEQYGIAGATRRPDLIVEARSGRGQPRYALVEVKRTHDAGYIADSVYKVLGYLADFGSAYPATQPGARALLVVWDGLSSPEPGAAVPAALPPPLVLATHHDYRRRLRALLEELVR